MLKSLSWIGMLRDLALFEERLIEAIQVLEGSRAERLFRTAVRAFQTAVWPDRTVV
jgi:hypothetical protein